MRLAALAVDGVEPDDWTLAPLFTLTDDGPVPRSSGMTPAEALADADLAAFPAVWSAYSGPRRRMALAKVEAATAAGLRVVVWVDGDQEVDLDRPGVVLFEQGPQRSRRRRHATVHAWPVLVHDHLRALFDGEVDPCPRGERPAVGFCGQAGGPPLAGARLLAGKARDRLAHRLGRTDRLAAPWASHLRLRRDVLARLEADDRVRTDFVVRRAYRAGLVDHADRADRSHPTATEFFANIRRTAYTVCVRGGGNFSTRLYETLCLGRIPVVVDTDQVLPWTGVVDWPRLAVVVDAGDLDGLADRVLGHHAGLDDEGFAAAQEACRALWVERLSVEGFFRHLPELLAP